MRAPGHRRDRADPDVCNRASEEDRRNPFPGAIPPPNATQGISTSGDPSSGFPATQPVLRCKSAFKFWTPIPRLRGAGRMTYLFSHGLPREQFSGWFQNVFLTNPTVDNLFGNLILNKTDTSVVAGL
jgi:hypothetical protein